MQHLVESELIEHLWDGVSLSQAQRDHLSLCAECQGHLTELAQMQREFGVARQSQVRPEVEASYVSLLTQATQPGHPRRALHHLIDAVTEWVQALPLWDSRRQPFAAGVRNAGQSAYRLLYGVNETEIELMIEPQNGLLRVVGEMMNEDADQNRGLALVELMASNNAKYAVETESDASGRFYFERVLPGTYTLTITPRYQQVIVIDALELA